jgi:hypothetical protein
VSTRKKMLYTSESKNLYCITITNFYLHEREIVDAIKIEKLNFLMWFFYLFDDEELFIALKALQRNFSKIFLINVLEFGCSRIFKSLSNIFLLYTLIYPIHNNTLPLILDTLQFDNVINIPYYIYFWLRSHVIVVRCLW